MNDSASFWTDIKDLEEQLANSPDSFCFAKLSDVYLKVGLVDDALHVARLGVLKHPGYLSGQRALSLACHAKGFNDEALAALRLGTAALPEDVPSQKLLGRISADAGDLVAACKAFRTVLDFAQDDVESKLELELLERSAGVTGSALEPEEDDEEIIEDLEILEDLDFPEKGQPEFEVRFEEAPPASDTAALPHNDPLSTGTLAELYVKQGFIHKALEIYRAILVENPADRAMTERVFELEMIESAQSEPETGIDDTFDVEAEDESACNPPVEGSLQETVTAALSMSDSVPAFENQQACADVSGYESGIAAVPPQGVADSALAALDGWLENIRRIKSCR